MRYCLYSQLVIWFYLYHLASFQPILFFPDSGSIAVHRLQSDQEVGDGAWILWHRNASWRRWQPWFLVWSMHGTSIQPYPSSQRYHGTDTKACSLKIDTAGRRDL